MPPSIGLRSRSADPVRHQLDPLSLFLRLKPQANFIARLQMGGSRIQFKPRFSLPFAKNIHSFIFVFQYFIYVLHVLMSSS